MAGQKEPLPTRSMATDRALTTRSARGRPVLGGLPRKPVPQPRRRGATGSPAPAHQHPPQAPRLGVQQIEVGPAIAVAVDRRPQGEAAANDHSRRQHLAALLEAEQQLSVQPVRGRPRRDTARRSGSKRPQGQPGPSVPDLGRPRSRRRGNARGRHDPRSANRTPQVPRPTPAASGRGRHSGRSGAQSPSSRSFLRKRTDSTALAPHRRSSAVAIAKEGASQEQPGRAAIACRAVGLAERAGQADWPRSQTAAKAAVAGEAGQRVVGRAMGKKAEVRSVHLLPLSEVGVGVGSGLTAQSGDAGSPGRCPPLRAGLARRSRRRSRSSPSSGGG